MGQTGWTNFSTSSDTQVVYVSSSGNDANPGTQQAPKRSLSAGYGALRNGYPDWLLLKSGDTWNDVFPGIVKSGRSSTEPLRIGSYGSGPRPRIVSANTVMYAHSAHAPTGSVAHVAITDLDIVGEYTSGVPKGIELLGNWSDVLVENCSIQRFATNIAFTADPSTESFTGLRVRRCVVAEAWCTTDFAVGSYFGGINGLLIEECVMDHNGWREDVPGATPTIFGHNIYIQTNCQNVVTRGIISARAAATGMQQRSGGLCEDHLFLQNPLGIVMGTQGTIQRCVVLDSRDVNAENPRGLGIETANSNGPFMVRDNICMWRTSPGSWNIDALANDHAANTTFQHNIVWKWRTAEGNGSPLWGACNPPPTLIDNNLEQTAPWVERSIGTYMEEVVSTSGGLAEFMTQARQQSRQRWLLEFTAGAVDAYVRTGWCYANCDGSPKEPVLNVADYTCFLQRFSSGDPWANCDASSEDPVLNVADFICYLQKVADGCP
jgi:hypothetical protein